MPRTVWTTRQRRGAVQRHVLLIVVLALWIQQSGGVSTSSRAQDSHGMFQLRKLRLFDPTQTSTPTATPTATPPTANPTKIADGNEPMPDVGILPMPPVKTPTVVPVTINPTESPTSIPTPETTTAAATPTPEPSDLPTATPTAATTELPSTPAPTPAPTTPPPTPAPTPAPTTQSPTEAPAPAPTTQSPTPAPTPAPTTQSPTQAPTPAPTTQSPTPAPTPAPTTQSPTPAPTPSPTEAPIPEATSTVTEANSTSTAPIPTVIPTPVLEEVVFSVLVLGESVEAGDRENLEKVLAAALEIPAENVTLEIGETMVLEGNSLRRLLQENQTVTEVLGQVLTEDPEDIRTKLNDEAVQQEIVDGAAEEGIEIVPSSFVVEEPNDDGSCDLTWEVLKFWELEFWTKNWCIWKIAIVASVGALILILLLWIILDCFCLKCCCGKMCSKGGGCCSCCSAKRESEKYRLENYDYRFQEDPQPDGVRDSEVELPSHASMQRPMYQADGYTDDQDRDELLGNTSSVSAAMPTRLTTESNPRLEERRPSGLTLNSSQNRERGRPNLQSPGNVDIDVDPMTDTDTEDDMDDSESEDFDDEDLSSINSPGPEGSPVQGEDAVRNSRLPSYSEDSEPGYAMDPNRHNQHLQQRPFAAQQQPAAAPSGRQQPYGSNQVTSQQPEDSDSESMLESSDPESDFSDMDSPMGAR